VGHLRRIAAAVRARTSHVAAVFFREVERRLELRRDVFLARRRSADLAIFHKVMPPPWGGGNQFLIALAGELEGRGLRIEWNTVSATTRACLYNSSNFDPERLRRFAKDGLRTVHRVDGPIAPYRGYEDGTDAQIVRLNDQFADATVVQSTYSLEEHRRRGIELRDPHLIPNAPDSRLFNPHGRVDLQPGDVVRLIVSSWSANPNKGASLVAELETVLDPARFELTFLGRSSCTFARTRIVPPVPSAEVGELLRRHHIYLAFSRFEPCSNALLEALACGLPVLYIDSGSHGELVGDAGLGFREPDEMPELLERLVAEWHDRQRAIRIASLREVADRYLEVLGL
jgi:glycosyltransferase involved in cell wall biosynthesis